MYPGNGVTGGAGGFAVTDHGEDTWAFLRRHPDYRAAWREHAAGPELEAAPFPVRVQSNADLAAAAPWSLLAWEDPGAVEDGLAWPFWDGVPMLEAIVSRRAAPLLPMLGITAIQYRGPR